LPISLTDAYRKMHRIDEAHRVGRAALVDAHAQAPSREVELLVSLGEAARERLSLAVMEAYLDELERARPDDCEVRQWVHELIAHARLFQLDRAGARRHIDLAPRCNEPIKAMRAWVLMSLQQSGEAGPQGATLEADLEAARAALPPAWRPEIDVYKARLMLATD